MDAHNRSIPEWSVEKKTGQIRYTSSGRSIRTGMNPLPIAQRACRPTVGAAHRSFANVTVQRPQFVLTVFIIRLVAYKQVLERSIAARARLLVGQMMALCSARTPVAESMSWSADNNLAGRTVSVCDSDSVGRACVVSVPSLRGSPPEPSEIQEQAGLHQRHSSSASQ